MFLQSLRVMVYNNIFSLFNCFLGFRSLRITAILTMFAKRKIIK